MLSITTITNRLNKDVQYVMDLCDKKNIKIHMFDDRMWLHDKDVNKLLTDEFFISDCYNNFWCLDEVACKYHMTTDEVLDKFTKLLNK